MTSMPTGWWLVVVIAGPALLLVAMRVFRRTARKLPAISKTQQWMDQGCCHACGYNLKGVESYVCPECGIVRLYSARQWKAKLAADAARRAEQERV